MRCVYTYTHCRGSYVIWSYKLYTTSFNDVHNLFPIKITLDSGHGVDPSHNHSMTIIWYWGWGLHWDMVLRNARFKTHFNTPYFWTQDWSANFKGWILKLGGLFSRARIDKIWTWTLLFNPWTQIFALNQQNCLIFEFLWSWTPRVNPPIITIACICMLLQWVFIRIWIQKKLGFQNTP